MSTSQNNWPVLTKAPSGEIPKYITGRVRPGDVETIFSYLCERFNSEVEKIKKGWSWGWAYRAIRGSSSGYSNHASGTAIDLNAPAHPLGRWNTFSPKQRQAIDRILKDLEGTVRAGKDYQNRPDDMHFEIDAGPAKVREVAREIRNGQKPKSASASKYKVKWVPVNIALLRNQFQKAVGVRKGKIARSNDVARIQAALNDEYKAGLRVDGYAGKNTVAAWKRHEQKIGGKDLKGVPDVESLRPLGKGRFHWYWPKNYGKK